MDLAGLRSALFDTSACIYLLKERQSPRAELITPFFRAAAAGELEGFISVITNVELLTGAFRSRDSRLESQVRRLISETCRVVPADAEIAERAALLRASYSLRTPDAIICATALVLQTEAVIGNDRRWKVVPDLHYLHIDDSV